jgi:hypothetical protein
MPSGVKARGWVRRMAWNIPPAKTAKLGSSSQLLMAPP